MCARDAICCANPIQTTQAVPRGVHVAGNGTVNDYKYTVECPACQHHGVHADERVYPGNFVRKAMHEQERGRREGMPPCVYEFQAGIMVIAPFNASSVPFSEDEPFHRRIERPVACGHALSSDGSDQGFVNSLVHGLHTMGHQVGLLNASYNALSRVQMARPRTWKRIQPALVHITGPLKPWMHKMRENVRKHPGNPFFRQEAEWLKLCGVVL